MRKLNLFDAGIRKAIIWVSIAIIICAVILLLLTPGGLSSEGHRFLALLSLVIIPWVSEAIPIGITGFGSRCGWSEESFTGITELTTELEKRKKG